MLCHSSKIPWRVRLFLPLLLLFIASPYYAKELNHAQKMARMVVTAELCQRWANLFVGDNRIDKIKTLHKNDDDFSQEYDRSVALFSPHQGTEDDESFRKICVKISILMDDALHRSQ